MNTGQNLGTNFCRLAADAGLDATILGADLVLLGVSVLVLSQELGVA